MKTKVTFILKNGQRFIVKCKSFKMTKLSGSVGDRSVTIEKADRLWSVDLSEIVAVSAKKCIF